MSHSKRNTSSALFTAYERSLLRDSWGSRSTHLSRDSFLPFGSCRLCLLPARDPVSCLQGHLFCRECAVSNLLAQKKEIKRLERERELRRAEEAERDSRDADDKLEREKEEFDRRQAGYANGESCKKRKNGMVGSDADWAGSKKARVEGQDDRVSSSFWVPGEDREAVAQVEKERKLKSICPSSRLDDDDDTKGDGKASRKPHGRAKGAHDFSLKAMVDVNFTQEPGATDDAPQRICPACKKGLSNTTHAVMAKPCGHVVCKSCADQFLKPPERHAHDTSEADEVIRCYVCSGPASQPPIQSGRGKGKKGDEKIQPGLIDIDCEGTGFAGGGQNTTKKAGVAFQC